MVQYRPKMFHPLKLQGQEFSQDLYRCSLDCCHGLVLELHGCKINDCDEVFMYSWWHHSILIPGNINDIVQYK
jgi:hypothetical protein